MSDRCLPRGSLCAGPPMVSLQAGLWPLCFCHQASGLRVCCPVASPGTLWVTEGSTLTGARPARDHIRPGLLHAAHDQEAKDLGVTGQVAQALVQ